MNNMQSAAFNFIKECLEDNGSAPTIREIADAIGLASASSAHGIVDKLVEEGYLRKVGTGKRRRIDINFDRGGVEEAVRLFREKAIGETRAMTLICAAVPEV